MPAGKRKPLLNIWLFELAADFLAVAVSYFLIYFARFHSQCGISFFSAVNRLLGVREGGHLGGELESFYIESAFRIVLLVSTLLVLLYAVMDLYSAKRPLRRRMSGWHLLQANAAALLIFYVYFYFSRNIFHPRSFFLSLMPVNALLTVLFRNLLMRFLEILRKTTGYDRVQALIAGSREDTDAVTALISDARPHGIEIAAAIETDLHSPFEEALARIEKSAADGSVDLLIMAERRLSAGQIMMVLEKCAELGLPAKILSDEFAVIVNQARIRCDLVKGVPLVHFEAPARRKASHRLSRLFDLFLSSLLILILSPLLSVIALLIKCSSKGPVFFRQERIGVNRRPFMMLKFRTMHNRADELRAQMEEFNESGRGLFKIRKDPRITGIGRLLRRLSLDELPQLINVLKGDMAIIGPRPLPRRDFEGYYENWHYSRHEGIPGITCLWQVSGRSDLDFHSMCILDVYYLRNRNWTMDLIILLRTVQAVLFARGAY